MPQNERPRVFDDIGNAYTRRGKSVLLLTGNTLDVLFSPGTGKFIRFEQVIYQELKRTFTIVRVDAASGITFYDDEDKREAIRVAQEADRMASSEQDKIGDLSKIIDQCCYQPLPTLVLLRKLSEAFIKVRRGNGDTKPLCVLIQFAGSLFPAGEFDKLSELDRQRLVTFLNWINDPVFCQSSNLVLLVGETMAEINKRIVAEPTVQPIEVELPNKAERALFVEKFIADRSDVHFEMEKDAFVEETAGLRLTALRDLLEGSARSATPLGRKMVLVEVNTILEAMLGNIIKVNRPEHGPADIIGDPAIGEIFLKAFRRCDNPETAVSALLVSGPNGSGKTYRLEAYATVSGRLVIELAGLRGSYFGETDKLFEMLKWHIQTFGKILILVDEAHTAFGSVHKSDTHETEKRLAGNIIKMMGDPKFLGRVLWGLMTSRPDELDPDVKSRAPLQIPIFDPEGDMRREFVRGIFGRKQIALDDAALALVLERTSEYSARDYNFLVREVKADGRPVIDVLDTWQASRAIARQRKLQELIAAEHCSYPALLPERLRQMTSEQVQAEIERLKRELCLF